MSDHRNKNIPNQSPVADDAYVTWQAGDTASFNKAQAAVGKAYASLQPIVHQNSISNFSVREGMDRNDYEFFRPGETLPRGRREVLGACLESYKRVSPIKSIFDMMVDFTTEGIRLVHPNPQVQQFYQNWWKKVEGTDRSQHFANNFYVMGTAIAKRNMAKLSARVVEELQKGWASAAEDSEVYDIQPMPRPKATRNVVPYSYDFLNPQVISMIGGELGLFVGKPKYGIDIPAQLLAIIRNPRTQEHVDLVNTLPAYIRDPIIAGSKMIVLDESRLIISHYRKNDWQAWADPILFSIMDDIILLQKMKLTDLAALDGAISHIRIWKLGSLADKIMPTTAAFQKLDEVLRHAGNGQSFDLIWGPDLTLDETSTDIHKYLGQAKYVSVYSSIYSGLGVPASLVGGTEGGKGGFTNNSMSLKTLIQRLNYGREALVKFWDNEIRIVQQAMQFRFPAQVEFRHPVLTDEAAFHSMLIDLLDRDVISVERIREHLEYIPEIEEAKVRSEWKARQNKKTPPKAGPFHDAEQEYGYKKIFAQTGVVTPSQLGLELDPAKPGEKTSLELRSTTKTPADPIKKGQQGQGRPRNSKDTTPRKTKRVVPRAGEAQSQFMDLMLWSREAQQAIADIVHPNYLKMCNKKNMRSLTTAETEDVEHLKFVLLCNIEPYSEISDKTIGRLMQEPLPAHPEADNFWKVLVATHMEKRGQAPTIEDIKQIQSYVYALYKGDYHGEDSSQC